MKVFILLGIFTQESESILGVYDSKEKAESAEKECRENSALYYDSYYVDEWEIE